MLLYDINIAFNSDNIKIQEICEFANKSLGLKEIDPEVILNSLYNDFGILIERSQGVYTFSHLQFHEYLTSLNIVHERKELSFLSDIKGNEIQWGEIILFIVKDLVNASDFIKSLLSNISITSSENISLIKAVLETDSIIVKDEKVLMIADFSNRAIDILFHKLTLNTSVSISLRERSVNLELCVIFQESSNINKDYLMSIDMIFSLLSDYRLSIDNIHALSKYVDTESSKRKYVTAI